MVDISFSDLSDPPDIKSQERGDTIEFIILCCQQQQYDWYCVNGHVGNWTQWQENFCILPVVWRGILLIRHIKLVDVWGLQWSKRFEVRPQSCKSECKCIIPCQCNVIQESFFGSKCEFEQKSKLSYPSWYYSDFPPLIGMFSWKLAFFVCT